MEHPDKIAESKIHKPGQLDEGFKPRETACRNPDQEQLSNGLDTREAFRTIYQQYLRTGRSATVLERLVEDNSGIKGRPSRDTSQAQEELNVLRPHPR